jgi:hypothetical protein
MFYFFLFFKNAFSFFMPRSEKDLCRENKISISIPSFFLFNSNQLLNHVCVYAYEQVFVMMVCANIFVKYIEVTTGSGGRVITAGSYQQSIPAASVTMPPSLQPQQPSQTVPQLVPAALTSPTRRKRYSKLLKYLSLYQLTVSLSTFLFFIPHQKLKAPWKYITYNTKGLAHFQSPSSPDRSVEKTDTVTVVEKETLSVHNSSLDEFW